MLGKFNLTYLVFTCDQKHSWVPSLEYTRSSAAVFWAVNTSHGTEPLPTNSSL